MIGGSNNMIKRILNKELGYKSLFDTKTGLYIRSELPGFGEPFMSSFPELIDIGIMGYCKHGLSGLCKKSGIECYQHGDISKNKNMSLSDYKSIIDECRGKTYQVALGGCGDPDQHENFEEILKYTVDNGIAPNFTTSGLGLSDGTVKLCKKYCGAVAVSMYSRLQDVSEFVAWRETDEEYVYNSIDDIPVIFTLGNIDERYQVIDYKYKIDGELYEWDELHHIELGKKQRYKYYRVYDEKENDVNNNNINYTMKAIKMLVDGGVKTNIHFVLSNKTIDEALLRLKYNGFPKGINAVIFLLHKPVGLGSKENMLDINDIRVKELFSLIDKKDLGYKVGFDSCCVPGLLNLCSGVDERSIEACEAARWSMYITPDMKGLTCSFDNQDMVYSVDIKEVGSIKSVWDSDKFNEVRVKLRGRCKGCKKQELCLGGCPLIDDIILCEKRKMYNEN